MTTELAICQERLKELPGQVSGLVARWPAEALTGRPLEGTGDRPSNSLAALAVHSAGAEHSWIPEGLGRRPATRNREAEFGTLAASTAEIVRVLETTPQESREVFLTLKGPRSREGASDRGPRGPAGASCMGSAIGPFTRGPGKSPSSCGQVAAAAFPSRSGMSLPHDPENERRSRPGRADSPGDERR